MTCGAAAQPDRMTPKSATYKLFMRLALLELPFAHSVIQTLENSRATSLVPTTYPGFQTRLPRMTQATVLRRPGNIAVMTRAAKLAADYAFHCHVVPARLHPDIEVNMTRRTTIANAVKPMRKNDRPNTLLFGALIDDYVSVLRPQGGDRKSSRTGYCDENNSLAVSHGVTDSLI